MRGETLIEAAARLKKERDDALQSSIEARAQVKYDQTSESRES
jgi:hypothetical protein